MTASIRVLRVIARMNVGGPALQVATLSQGLPKSRFEQLLLTGDVGPGEADYVQLRAKDVHAQHVAGLGRSLSAAGDARAFATLITEIRRFRPHIVHTHTAKAGLLGRLAALACRVPAIVHTFHGHLLHGYFSPTVTRAVVSAERALASRTTRLIAVGEQVRDELLQARIGRRDQYLVVAPGISLPTVPSQAVARACLSLPRDIPVVAYVARLTWVKRPDRLVEVARLVAELRPDVVFLVAGEGDLLDDMRSRASSLGDRVRFLGWRKDVETVYAAADVVVLTSDNEGMPVSLIEAASAGCPAVATRAGSVAEVVSHGVTGFVTDKSPRALADATCRVLDDRALRARLSAAAVDHADTHFGRQRLIDDVAFLYEQLAATNGPNRGRTMAR